MIEVDVRIVFGDYEIHWSEQEYHDERVSYFKWKFADIIRDVKFNMTIPLIVDCEYYPKSGKFKITSVTLKYRNYVNRATELNPKFVKEYLL